jgi:uncharacterized membrane protein
MAYADKVRRDIARWRAAGLVNEDLAAALEQDVGRHHGRGVSFGAVLALMAAALVAAAILILIAANWEAFPRLLRVAALFLLIAGGYIGGAVLKLRGHSGWAEAAWLVAAASFGGALALIGQMYHLSGDEAQAVLVWCLGTAFAAAVLRSPHLTSAAVLLAVVWLLTPLMGEDFGGYGYLALAALLWGLGLWNRSDLSRHAILISLALFGLLRFFQTSQPGILVVVALLSAGLVVAAARYGDHARRYLRLATAGLAIDGLAGFLIAMVALQAYLIGGPQFILAAAATLAGIAGALLLAGRQSWLLRWLAYAGFALELCFVYVTTVGSMIGTAGFFLLAGLAVGGLAFLILRLERRLSAPALGGSA